jgi:uncharacterized membrane protein
MPSPDQNAENQAPAATTQNDCVPHGLLAPSIRAYRRTCALLRWLTLTAGLIILAGGLLFLRQSGPTPTHFHTFHGEPASLRHLPLILAGASHAQPLAIIQLGILLLIAMPVARVAAAGLCFALDHDRLYTAISTLVLAILLASFLGHGF